MGNDGGSIPRRNEMVREKKKDEKMDRRSQLIAMFFTCALSKRPLQQPIVSDGLGRLYNREAVLEYLLDNSIFGDGAQICSHIKGLKDIKTLNLKPNPSLNKDGSLLNADQDANRPLRLDEQPIAQFVCPVTMKEMNGNLPFEYSWTCGCVFSAQARKEVCGTVELGASEECVVCGKIIEAEDIIPINSQDPKVLDSLQQRMNSRLKKAESGKKKNKKKDTEKKEEKTKSKDKRKYTAVEEEEDGENDKQLGAEDARKYCSNRPVKKTKA